MTEKIKHVFLKKGILLILLTPLCLILLAVSKKNTEFTGHVFSRVIYRGFSLVYSNITGILPFSLAEFLIIVAPVMLIVVLIGFIVRLIKDKNRRAELCMKFVRNVLIVASVAYFVYAFGYGASYYRYPAAKIFELEVRDSSKEELLALFEEQVQKATAIRKQLTTVDEKGNYMLPAGPYKLAKETKKAYTTLSEKYPIILPYYPGPKCVMLSEVMSRTMITGIFTCWTMEANVDIDIPDYSIASTMCHELAHLQGFMREDEANFIAYLACMESGNLDLEYSGIMHALIYTGNALYGKDPDLYNQTYQKYGCTEVISDLIANNRYWKKYEKTVIAETADAINDSYLKANDQEDGVESYGRVVDLLLALYRKEHGLN